MRITRAQRVPNGWAAGYDDPRAERPRTKDQGPRTDPRTRDQGRTKDQGPRTKNGPGTKDQGRTKHQGLGTKDRPMMCRAPGSSGVRLRRDPDRQRNTRIRVAPPDLRTLRRHADG